MTMYRSTSTLSEPVGRERIPSSQIAYIQTRTKLDMFNIVRAELKASGLSQAEIAERLGKGTDRISKILSAPGNWTLDTVSELLFAISGGMLDASIKHPLRRPKRNDIAPRWLTPELEKDASSKNDTSSKSMRIVSVNYETV
jgi:transcriptional regulator with XRE-family HTH domain